VVAAASSWHLTLASASLQHPTSDLVVYDGPMTGGTVFASLVSLVLGAAGSYVAFYIRGALALGRAVAKSLADFYASAAVVYYSAKDYQRAPESDGGRFTYYKLFDQHYEQFLAASTMLASLVPPGLREEILRVEDLWDQIKESGFEAVPSKLWFDTLDAMRNKVLDSIVYSRVTDPFWKFQG